MHLAITSSDDISYFINVAVIAATLVGLTFVVGTFFIVDLLRRYEHVSFPVFRQRNPEDVQSIARNSKHPQSLNDFELFDGDPLVVFIAFSLAVTWNLFLMPLAIGLTAAWGNARLWIIMLELLFLCGFLVYSFRVRMEKIDSLCPYLTREELLWPLFGKLALAIYIAALIAIGISLISTFPFARPLAVWRYYGNTNERAAVFALKTICVLSLLIGTYTTNKDMFIFFKTMAAERMRQRWLQDFIQDAYPKLSHDIARYKEAIPAKKLGQDHVMNLWNNGVPKIVSTHEAITKGGDGLTLAIWEDLKQRKGGTPVWMLDIPRIAEWAADLEAALNDYASHVAATKR